MSFYNEILKSAGLKDVGEILDYNVIIYGGKALYIDGIKRFLKIDPAIVSIDTGKNILDIEGELIVSLLEEKSCIIKGKIFNISVREKDEVKKSKLK